MVLRRGQAVGRVYFAVNYPRERAWLWSTLTLPGAHGMAATMDEALNTLREWIRERWPDDVGRLPMLSGKG